MCVIIIKESDAKLSPRAAQRASIMNPHGLGIVWLDTYRIEYHKSSAWKLLDTTRPFIAHFRYASVGKVSMDNVHPFRCGQVKNEFLMMNGTIYGMGSYNKTDTQVLAHKLGEMPRAQWAFELSKYNCRFVTINVKAKSFQVYNEELWFHKDGMRFSKGQIFQDNLIAVYGTLKKGEGNYDRFLSDAVFVGKGRTKDKYPLVVKGLPYLYEEKGKGHRVEVDMFNVNDEQLADIDKLEGHPNFYKRVQITVKGNDRNEYTCWVYFNQYKHNYTKDDFVSSYVSNRPVTRPSESTWYQPARYTPIGYKPAHNPTDYELGIFPKKVVSHEFTAADFNMIDMKDEGEDETDVDIESEEPMCPDCFNDVEFDGFANYYCNSCGTWFTEDEVKKFMCQ